MAHFIIYIVSIIIIGLLVVALPINISRSFRIKIAIVSSMLVVLSLLLYELYSLWISLTTFFVLSIFFSFLLAKQLMEEEDEIVVEETFTPIRNEIHIKETVETKQPSNRRKTRQLHQGTIDQLVKKEVEHSADEIVEQKNEDLQKDEDAQDNKEVNQDKNEELDDEVDISIIFENRSKSLLEDESVEEQGSSLMSHLEENPDEEGPLLGRQFADLDEEEGLPPRPSAFTDDEVVEEKRSVEPLDIEEEDLLLDRANIELDEDDTKQDDEIDKEGFLHRSAKLDEKEIEEEISLVRNDVSDEESQEDKLDEKHNDEIEGNANIDTFSDTILLKRSELFEQLEDETINKKK